MISSQQRRQLKALAQRLDAIFKVGKKGLSDPFLASVRAALQSRELIKVRFDEFKEQRQELAPLLAARTDSHLVALVGNVAVLFRPQPNPAKPKSLHPGSASAPLRPSAPEQRGRRPAPARESSPRKR